VKALVMEIRDEEAVLLDEEGIFRIVENQNYETGQEVDIDTSLLESNIIPFRGKNKDGRKRPGMKGIAAACLTIILSGGMASFVLPSSQVQARGNTSLTYQLNIWNRVIAIEGSDREGNKIAKSIDVGFPGRPMDEVVEETFDMMESLNKDDQLEEMEFSIQSHFPGQKERTEEHIEKYKKDWEDRKEKHNTDIEKRDKKEERNSGGQGPAESTSKHKNKDNSRNDSDSKNNHSSSGNDKSGNPVGKDNQKQDNRPKENKDNQKQDSQSENNKGNQKQDSQSGGNKSNQKQDSQPGDNKSNQKQNSQPEDNKNNQKQDNQPREDRGNQKQDSQPGDNKGNQKQGSQPRDGNGNQMKEGQPREEMK